MSDNDAKGGARPATGLAAVLFMDLPDFDRLLASSEKDALAVLSRYRGAVDPVVLEHGGEPVDVTGSELLIVFGSAVTAVQCALHLALSARGALAGNPGGALAPRMGLHLGEIWRDERRVYGNGVNVAARVMQAAGPGVLLLSEDVYRQVATKLDLAARETGDLPLKNIERALVLWELDTGLGFLSAPSITASLATASPPAAGDAAGIASMPAGSGASPGVPLPPGAPEPPLPETLAERASGDDVPGEKTVTLTMDFPGLGELAESGKVSGGLDLLVLRQLGELGKLGELAKLGKLDKLAKLEKLADLDIVVNAGSTGAAPTKKGPYDPEAARAKAARDIQGAVQKLFISAGVAGGMVYGYLRTDSLWFVLGAGLLGLLPFLSGIRALFKAGADIRAADRALERSARKRGRG